MQSINADLTTLGPVFVNLKWKSAFTSGETAPSGSLVTSISGGSDVEIANFDSTGSDSYIMLVNRKCDLNDFQTVTVNTNKTGNWILDDQLADELFVSSNGVFKEVKLNPGQGRLFRVCAMTTNENWSGAIYVSNGITIASGSTLTIQPGATTKFSSGASLTINGKIIADSNDPTKRITFTGTSATPGFWNGITINASANPSVLRRCDVQYATDGLIIYYTGNTDTPLVEKCNIRNHSYDDIFMSGNNYSGATVHPRISNNTISNNGSLGIEIADYAKPTLTGNRIENNTSSGLFADTNCNARIEYNYISGNGQYVLWFIISSSAKVHRNTVKTNGSTGIICASNSGVIACGANADTTKGRNEITGNSGVGLYASNSTPNFGFDQSTLYGKNWIHDNTSYEAQQVGTDFYILAKRCYWNGQQSNISGVVYTSPVLGSAPNPVGWGRSPSYDPTYLKGFKPGMIAELLPDDGHHNTTMRLMVTTGTNGAPA